RGCPGADGPKPAVQCVQRFDDGAVRTIGQRVAVASDRMRFPAQIDHEFGHRTCVVRDPSVDPEPGGAPRGSPGRAEFEGFVAGCLSAWQLLQSQGVSRRYRLAVTIDTP